MPGEGVTDGGVKSSRAKWPDVPLTLVISFALLLAMVVGSIALAVKLERNIVEHGRTWAYRKAITDVLIALRDAEIGQRGYLITGNADFLAPYRSATATLPPLMTEASALGFGRGKATMDRMRPVVDAKLFEMSSTISLMQSGRRADAVARIQAGEGKRLMDQLRLFLESERQWSLAQAQMMERETERAVRAVIVGLVAGLVSIVVLLLIWLRQSRRQFAELQLAQSEAQLALTGLQHEVEAREASETQLRQLQKMQAIGQLTGGIAHDFNNMLAVVMSGIELAKRRLRSDPDQSDTLLDAAMDGARKAAALTNRLLAFSRNQPLAPQPLDLNLLIGGMSDLLSRSLGEAIAVETVRAAGLWRCYADGGEVENALLNLAVNARDAMPDGGKLTIETCNVHVDDRYAETHEMKTGQYVQICVTDTGEGMSADVIERAFDPFFTTKDVGKGTGLGLSQVFGFAKQSDGHVSIYSEVGEGTTVRLYLPRYFGSAALPDASSALDDAPQGSKSEVILVVEDDARVRQFACDVLHELGYATVAAETPESALETIRGTAAIALLFTDIVKPLMNGRRLADLAREIRPDLKVLYTTGYTQNAVVHNGTIDIGVAFLAKPYSIRDMAKKIRDVLDGRGANRVV